MEIMLRCQVPDRPGALARLAGAISAGGGDIEAVDVVEAAGGTALDDLVVVIEGPAQLQVLCDRLEALADVELVHIGVSRGAPGDAVTRLAVGLEALLNGAMTLDHGVQTLLGGLLRASQARLVTPVDAPKPDQKTLVLAIDERVLVLERDYRFTDTERERAAAILRVALEAVRTHAA